MTGNLWSIVCNLIKKKTWCLGFLLGPKKLLWAGKYCWVQATCSVEEKIFVDAPVIFGLFLSSSRFVYMWSDKHFLSHATTYVARWNQLVLAEHFSCGCCGLSVIKFIWKLEWHLSENLLDDETIVLYELYFNEWLYQPVITVKEL